MTSYQFLFFLSGLLKGIKPGEGMGEHQLASLRDTLNSVFVHEIDPSMGSAEHQRELDALHSPSHLTSARLPTDAIIKC